MNLSLAVVQVVLAAGLATFLGLHFLEPALSSTWSYAHLSRHPTFPWIGAVLVVTLPPLVVVASRHERARERPREITWAAVAVAALIGWVVLAAIGLTFPARPMSWDAVHYMAAVTDGGGWLKAPHWPLTALLFHRLSMLLRPAVTPNAFVCCAHALLATIAFLCLAGSARRLGRTRGEVTAITLLCWTAFGTVELAVGYRDIYPVALAATAAYLWISLRALRGEIHPAWPLLVAAVGPFLYIGLILLLPSLTVIAIETLRRPAGRLRLAVATALAIAAAGAATFPGYGLPFAWKAHLNTVVFSSGYERGLSPTSSLLPLGAILSSSHVREVLSSWLLVDGVGLLLMGVCGGWVIIKLPWTWNPRAATLALVVLPYLAYSITMDPLIGAYADWDLFSFGAPATSLLGAYAFVVWGRESPTASSFILGVALAAALVHLLARFHGLHIDFHRHLAESPMHSPF